MTTTEKPGPQTPCKRYFELEALRMPARDFMGGAPVLKRPDKAAIYLPRNPAEGQVRVPGIGVVDRWQIRVDNARLWPKFSDTVEDAVGRIFSKPIKLSDDMPSILSTFLDDVDRRGSKLDVFLQGVAEVAASEGSSFVFVDFPKVESAAELSFDEEQRMGLTPFWRTYSPGSVIDWEFGSWRGRPRLLMVRLREEIAVRKEGGYGFDDVIQIRELFAGNPEAPSGDPSRWVRWNVYRPNDRGEYTLAVDANGKAMTGLIVNQVDIPLVEFPTRVTKPFECAPPFSNLLHMNISHIRKLSLLDNGQQAVGFPFPYWEKGPQPSKEGVGEIKVSESNMIIGPEGSDLRIVEVAGTAWAEMRATIEQLEAQMNDAAAEAMRKDTGGPLTVTGEKIRNAKNVSRLARWALLWEDATSQCLYLTAQYMKLVPYGADKGWGSVELNKVYVPTGANQVAVTHRQWMVEQGILTKKTALEAAQADEIVPETIDAEEEIEAAERESLARMPEPLGGGDPGADPDADPDPDDPANDDPPQSPARPQRLPILGGAA